MMQYIWLHGYMITYVRIHVLSLSDPGTATPAAKQPKDASQMDEASTQRKRPFDNVSAVMQFDVTSFPPLPVVPDLAL